MKSLLILTNIKFWQRSSGDKCRLFSLIAFFKEKTCLTIAYGGQFDAIDRELIAGTLPDLNIIIIGNGETLPLNEYIGLVDRLFKNNSFDVCIVEYVFLTRFIDLIPKSVVVMLDAHDIIHDSVESFNKYNYTYSEELLVTREMEFEQFRKYDYVILMKESDVKKVAVQIGAEKVILAPHPGGLPRQNIRKSVKKIVFVASAYLPNVDAINWFIRNVWKNIRYPGITLNIYGSVCGLIRYDDYEDICIMGFTSDLNDIYSSADILINPVRIGAGLKIKNVEALSCGLPLITTSHGAMGLEAGINKAFLVADSIYAFCERMNYLISDFGFRSTLAEQAFQFAEKNFSAKSCYEALLKKINL